MEGEYSNLCMEDYHSVVETAIHMCDKLLAQLERYSVDLQKEPLSPTLDQLNPMKKWNEKRRDDRMQARHDDLMQDIANIEGKLRELILSGTIKKEALRKQFPELMSDLVDYGGQLKVCKLVIEGNEENVRDLINLIAIETEELKSMVAFNREVIKQVETANFFGSWGDIGGSRLLGRGRNSRKNLKLNDRLSPRFAAEENDEDQQGYLERLGELRACRDWMVLKLSLILEKKELINSLDIELSNHLEEIGRNDGSAFVMQESANTTLLQSFENHKGGLLETLRDTEKDKKDNEAEAIIQRASSINATAFSYCENLRLLKSDVMEANTRLRLLVESREKTRDSVTLYSRNSNGSGETYSINAENETESSSGSKESS